MPGCRKIVHEPEYGNMLARAIRDLQLDIQPIRAAARRRLPEDECPVSLKQRVT
jgi:hypothetical protein